MAAGMMRSLLGCLVVAAPLVWGRCQFTLDQAEVIAKGPLMHFDMIWGGEGSALMAHDLQTKDIVVYPQKAFGDMTEVHGEKTVKHTFHSYSEELFLVFDKAGKFKWSKEGYSTMSPAMIGGNLILASEMKMHAYHTDTGSSLWSSKLCTMYKQSTGPKFVNDMFSVAQSKYVAGDDLYLGIMMSMGGHCQMDLKEGAKNLSVPLVPHYHFPYLLKVDMKNGDVKELLPLGNTKMDYVSNAFEEEDGTFTLVGMVTGSLRTTTLVAANYKSKGAVHWETHISSNHSHDFIWSMMAADDEHNEILFVVSSEKGINITVSGTNSRIDGEGVIFGALDKADGHLLWHAKLEYKGEVTPTGIHHLSKDTYLVNCVWDGRAPLVFGQRTTLRPFDRPMAGNLAFMGVFERPEEKPDGRWRFVHEVAPAVVYPGHQFNVLEVSDTRAEVASVPAFWGSFEQFKLDATEVVPVSKPINGDVMAMVRYNFDSDKCHGGTSAAASPGKGHSFFLYLLIILLASALVAGGFYGFRLHRDQKAAVSRNADFVAAGEDLHLDIDDDEDFQQGGSFPKVSQAFDPVISATSPTTTPLAASTAPTPAPHVNSAPPAPLSGPPTSNPSSQTAAPAQSPSAGASKQGTLDDLF